MTNRNSAKPPALASPTRRWLLSLLLRLLGRVSREDPVGVEKDTVTTVTNVEVLVETTSDATMAVRIRCLLSIYDMEQMLFSGIVPSTSTAQRMVKIAKRTTRKGTIQGGTRLRTASSVIKTI